MLSSARSGECPCSRTLTLARLLVLRRSAWKSLAPPITTLADLAEMLLARRRTCTDLARSLTFQSVEERLGRLLLQWTRRAGRPGPRRTRSPLPLAGRDGLRDRHRPRWSPPAREVRGASLRGAAPADVITDRRRWSGWWIDRRDHRDLRPGVQARREPLRQRHSRAICGAVLLQAAAGRRLLRFHLLLPRWPSPRDEVAAAIEGQVVPGARFLRPGRAPRAVRRGGRRGVAVPRRRRPRISGPIGSTPASSSPPPSRTAGSASPRGRRALDQPERPTLRPTPAVRRRGQQASPSSSRRS